MQKTSTISDRIQWHEGMLLAPQHFQQLTSRVDELVAAHTLIAAPFAWGVRRFTMDSGLLPAGIVRVLELELVFQDGTMVNFDASNSLHGALELHLSPYSALLANEPLNVYVLLPLNKRMHDASVASRYRSVSAPPVDDHISEAVPADIPRLLPNLSLSAGEAPSALYSSLRLGCVLKDNELLKWSPVEPPLLEVPRDGDLWARVSAFCGQLRGKAAFVAKQTAVPSSKTEDRLAYLEQRERLRNLLTALPPLEAVLRTPHLHPYGLYMALCSLLAPLSMLRPGSLPMVPTEYDHGDPTGTLNPILASLSDALMEVNQEYREYKFEFRYGAFELLLKSDWVDKQLVLGLRGQPERDLVAWMGGAIIGSQSAYASLREKRVLGATRNHIEVAEDLGVRASSGYTLFSIQTNPLLTIADEPLIVSNSAESASAQRPQEMVLFVKG